MELKKIHSDQRGTIYSLQGDPLTFEEISIIHTNSGFARGACYHPENQEHLTVAEGLILYIWSDNQKIMKEGESITIPAKTPHMLISLTNSIVLEWGTLLSEKGGEKDPEMKKLVDIINNKKV